MGILRHDTNNIVCDAVLTSRGRELLARNDGSFHIVKFALSDDEVDYSVIKQYGRSVGKEKIEKNTLVFEALTNPDQAQKYRMVTVSNPHLLRLPSLSLSADGLTGNVVSMGRTTTRRRTVTVSQTLSSETSIDVELRDQVFSVEMNSLFLQVANGVPDTIDSRNTARYLLTRDGEQTGVGGSRLTFTIELRSISDNLFSVYGNVSDRNTIRTAVRVSGLQSGATSEFFADIAKSG